LVEKLLNQDFHLTLLYIFDPMNIFTRFCICFITLTLYATNTRAVLPAPMLYSPTSGITLRAFEAFLSYSSITGATGYQLQYDTAITFNSPHLRVDTSNLSYQYTKTLYKGRKYYWRVRSYKPGDTSTWSVVYNFTVFTKANLGLPSNTSTGGITAFLCNSVASNTPCTYFFEADTTSAFNSPLYTFKTQSEAAFIDTPLFEYGRTLYWRARASSPAGDTLDWSDTWRYTFYTKPVVNAGFANEPPQTNITWPTLYLAETILQVDTTTAFNSPMLSEKTLARMVVADTLRNLTFGRRYYYRIRGRFVNSLSDWSDTKQMTVVQNGYINTPNQGQTIPLLLLTFGWQRLTGALTQFQLYNDSNYTDLLKDSVFYSYGYSYPDTFMLNKKYYMRIRYYHEKDTTPWIYRWFKTYNGGVLLSSPYNNTINNDVRLRFSFYKEPWATGYITEIDTGSTFGTYLSGYGIRLTSFDTQPGGTLLYADTSLRYNQTYVWRVTAIKGQDTASASQSYVFKTSAAPVCYYPPNNTIGTGTGNNALVTGIKGSTWMQWELDTSLSFLSGEHFSGTAPHVPDDFSPNYVNLDWPNDLLFESKYYWRARCINPVDTGPWSAPFNFVTTQQPYNTEPANNTVGLDPENTITLKWSIQGSASDYIYQYQISTDANFAGAPVVSLPADESPEVKLNLMYSTRYYWRARATHSRDTSLWSSAFTFTTIAPPVIYPPMLALPANKATNIALGPVILQWNNTAFAKQYEVQVSSDSVFGNIVASATTAGNGASFSGAQPRTKYYWRVRGSSGNNIGLWSAEWWFQMALISGIDEAENSILMSIMPNPATDVFTVESKEAGAIQVYNSSGACVYYDDVLQRNRTVSTQDWAGGIYFVLVRAGEKQSTKRIMINK
jgi:hypothetical protein